jgi:hypothetical protein
MSSTASELLALIAPEFNIRSNWFSLSTELIVDNVISVTVNGQTAVETYNTNSDTTLNNLRTKLELLPVVKTVELSGLVFSITTERDEISLSAVVTGGISQAVVTVGEINTDLRDMFLKLALLQTNECWYGIKYNYATALRAAHLLYLDAQNQSLTGGGDVAGIGNGTIKEMQQDELSITYGAVSELKDSKSAVVADLSRSPYGITLLSLTRAANTSMMSTGGMMQCP